jgi:hypothetical protein
MTGKPQDARHGSGTWRPGGRMSAVRVVAALTMTYSAAITVAPRLLAKPCRLLDQDGRVPPGIAIWFGSLPLTLSQRAKIGGAAAGWSAIETVAQLADRRP